jgi:prepilin-type N-terminal cleavage/methylation domain-containing protein
MKKRRASLRGFTLVEALVAIAVMAIAIPILLQGFILANTISEKVRKETEATAVAQSALDEILATQVYNNISGEIEVNGTSYAFSSSQDAYESETNVSQLVVTVTWPFKGQERSIELSTIVYIPQSTSQSVTPLGGGGLP